MCIFFFKINFRMWKVKRHFMISVLSLLHIYMGKSRSLDPKGSRTLSIPKCPWKGHALVTWNHCPHPYTVKLGKCLCYKCGPSLVQSVIIVIYDSHKCPRSFKKQLFTWNASTTVFDRSGMEVSLLSASINCRRSFENCVKMEFQVWHAWIFPLKCWPNIYLWKI